MAIHNSKNITTAKKLASRFRKQGFQATVYNPKGKGVRVSVKRK